MADDLNILVERKLVLGASDVTRLLIRALGLPEEAVVTDDQDMSPPRLVIRWSVTETFAAARED